ncbi:MAG: hypothetical protein LUC96_11025, partial [Alistipes sp.]|uniref:hypothetical protein n=1 Tax=Alistipes sp. TaxID=1872444 RepID=UPI0025BA9722
LCCPLNHSRYSFSKTILQHHSPASFSGIILRHHSPATDAERPGEYPKRPLTALFFRTVPQQRYRSCDETRKTKTTKAWTS